MFWGFRCVSQIIDTVLTLFRYDSNRVEGLGFRF